MGGSRQPASSFIVLSKEKGRTNHVSSKYAGKKVYTVRKNTKRGIVMELPKNIVQIGKPDRVHKIFVEDYVVSYIKQLSRENDGRAVGLALYGRYEEEEALRYYFLYGAAKIDGLEHRGPYLTQVEKEEIANVGAKYFDGYDFLAWCSVKEEPVEGFYVQVQGKGVQINGYACFYEKNESMLNYMLIMERQEKKEKEKRQERVDRQEAGTEEKRTEGRPARGEWNTSDYRKSAPEHGTKAPIKLPSAEKRAEYMKVAAAAAFVVLCVIGITTLNDYEKLEELQAVAGKVIAGLSEQKLPDMPDESKPDNTEKPEETLEASKSPEETTPSVPANAEAESQVSSGEGAHLSIGEGAQAPAGEEQPVRTDEQQPEPGQVASSSDTVTTGEPALPTAYTVVKGDTLISICLKHYGSLDKLLEICEMNGITNPDNIAVGQTILLP